MEAIQSRYSPYELGFEGLTPSMSCEFSLYTLRLARLQRKLPPQGTWRLISPHAFQDMSYRFFSLWRCDIGLAFMQAFARASKLSRTGPRVNPESIPPTLAPNFG